MFFEIPDPESSHVLSDWLELQLAAGEEQLSKAKVASIIESLTGSEPNETFLADIWRELEERQSRYSRQFFTCQSDLVVRGADGDSSPEYIACLLFALYANSSEHGGNPKIFERLVAHAIRNHVQGKMFVFGWPVLSPVEADIALRVKAVAE